MSSPRRVRLRRNRHESSTATTSLLSVPGAVGLDAVGFEPVGDVMGAVTAAIAEEVAGGCGYQVGNPSTIGVKLGGARTERRSLPLARQLEDAYARLTERVVREAEAMSADGVVDIRIRAEVVEEQIHQLTATGTAVRARSTRRPLRPFTTDLSGSDLAKLIQRGWVPVRLHTAVETGIRHDDSGTLFQAGIRGGNRANIEVIGYVELNQRVGVSVRQKLARQIAHAGGEGGLLGRFEMVSSHQRCWVRSTTTVRAPTDHTARAIATGTSIARFARPSQASPRSLTIMPVNDRRVPRSL